MDKNDEKLIIEKVRQLLPHVDRCVEFTRWNTAGEEDDDRKFYASSIIASGLIEEIEKLIGYKEDEIQPGTKYKNGKLF